MQFQVRALSATAQIVESTVEPGSREEALARVARQGMRGLSARPLRSLTRRSTSAALPIALFSQELATLLGAGLPLVDAVQGLADKEENSAARKVYLELARALYEGKAFSQAVAEHPSIFPELYVALMRSAERTGDLPVALRRFVTYRNQTDEVRKKLVSASIYPVVLLVAGTAVLLFLVGYVVPKFSQVYEDMRGDLPWLSQMLLAWGRLISEHQLELLAALAALGALGAAAWRQGRLREHMGRLVEALPGVSKRIFVYRLSRLYRSLGILLRGGIPILPAIGMVRGLVPAALRQRIDSAAARIREGVSLSQAFESNSLVTPIALRMLRAGEKSGNLGEMMEQTADFHDEEIARWIDWFVRLIEPVMMTIIGGVIGVIVVLMYIPIFELAGSIQ